MSRTIRSPGQLELSFEEKVMEGPDTKLADETGGLVAEDERNPKRFEKLTTEEKYERQKRSLQRLTIATLRGGQEHGLNDAQVSALTEALEVLGWLPRELRL